MKVLLLQPPIRDYYHSEGRLFPLGLCALKAALLRHVPGVEVVVRDFHQGFGRRTVEVPRELGDLEPYYPYPDRSPFRTFHRYYHFGAPFEVVGEAVAAEAPDLVGISSLFSAYHREVLRVAEEVKKRVRAPVVVGGAHASAAPASLLAHPAVDYVIRGEGERPLIELVRALASAGPLEAVPNLGRRGPHRHLWTQNGANDPLEELPPADPSDLEPGAYRLEGRPLAAVASSRGCPRRCSFCAAHAASGGGYRRRPAKAVVADLRELYRRGYRAFDFEDDNLTSDRAGAEELLRALPQAFPLGDVRFAAMNGLWWPSLDAALLDLLWKAGFRALDLSAVSADPGAAGRAGRPPSGERFARIAGEAAARGFRVTAYLILGLPGEPLASILNTFASLARLPVRLGASPFYLPPGSPLAGPGEPPGAALVRARLTALSGTGSGATRDEVYTLWVASRIVNFLKELPAGAETLTLGEALERARALGGRWRLGAERLEALRREGVLCAATPVGPKPLPRFDGRLFARLAAAAGAVRGHSGGAVAFA